MPLWQRRLLLLLLLLAAHAVVGVDFDLQVTGTASSSAQYLTSSPCGNSNGWTGCTSTQLQTAGDSQWCQNILPVSSADCSEYIDATQFGFDALLSDATWSTGTVSVTALQLRWDSAMYSGADTADEHFLLRDNSGSTFGSERDFGAPFPQQACCGTNTVGGDTWGTTINLSTVRTSGFGVRHWFDNAVIPSGSNADNRADFAEITVDLMITGTTAGAASVSGPAAAAGTTVTVAGSNFVNTNNLGGSQLQCRFADTSVSDANHVSLTQVTCGMPSFSTNQYSTKVEVTLNNGGAWAQASTTIDYWADVDPTSAAGPSSATTVGQGDRITITGSNFGRPTPQCRFSYDATSVTVSGTRNNDAEVVCDPLPDLDPASPVEQTPVTVELQDNFGGSFTSVPGVTLQYEPGYEAPPPIGGDGGGGTTDTGSYNLVPVLIGAGSLVCLGSVMALVIVGRKVAKETEIKRKKLEEEELEKKELEKQLNELDRRSKLFGHRWTRMSLFAPSEAAVEAALADPDDTTLAPAKKPGKAKGGKDAGGWMSQASVKSGANVASRQSKQSQASKRSRQSMQSRQSKQSVGLAGGKRRSRARSAPAARLRKAAGAPVAFIDVVYFIEDKALDEEGIFRLPGAKEEVDEIVGHLKSRPGSKWVPGERQDVHAAASAVKQYAREMPGGLIKPEMRAQITGACGGKQGLELAQALAMVVSKMPPRNLDILRRLCVLFEAISKHTDLNKMTANNLATSVGPSLVGGDTGDMGVGALVITAGVEHLRVVFG